MGQDPSDIKQTIDSTRGKIADTVDSIKSNVAEGSQSTKSKLADTASDLRAKLGDTAQSVSASTGSALDAVSSKLPTGGGTNVVPLLIGAGVAGVVAGLLAPLSPFERERLQPVGDDIVGRITKAREEVVVQTRQVVGETVAAAQDSARKHGQQLAQNIGVAAAPAAPPAPEPPPVKPTSATVTMPGTSDSGKADANAQTTVTTPIRPAVPPQATVSTPPAAPAPAAQASVASAPSTATKPGTAANKSTPGTSGGAAKA